MGGHETSVTSGIEKKCRPHPLRRIAQFICTFRNRPESKSQLPEHTCVGPSFLHNFLPILEPFLLLDLDLLFIEDRILGRQQAPQIGESHKVPSDLQELKTWVKDATIPCDCDVCSPLLYQLGIKSSHGNMIYRMQTRSNGSRTFRRAQNTPLVPQPELSLRFYGEYEAMRLVRHHVTWLDNTYLQSPPEDGNLKVLQLKGLLHNWNPNLTGQDMRHTMSSAQFLHLIKLLNQIFFFGAVPSHRQAISSGFSWLPESEQACFGIGTFNPVIGTQVLLHPILYRHGGDPEDLDARWRNRIGTVLHELCHAFLKAYTCRSCPMHDKCIGARGHGRAWQILAAKMEEVATKLMGGYVDFGRYPSLLHDLEGNGKLPSAHDLEVLKYGTHWPAAQEG
jgi:hypothetical protein